MARPRLRTQLSIATLIIISALTGALLFIIRYTVRSEITKQVQDSTAASLRAFQNVQQERELDRARDAAVPNFPVNIGSRGVFPLITSSMPCRNRVFSLGFNSSVRWLSTN